jgi:hypothetical protein
LYSQAKQCRRQTSAQPSPPPVFFAPFSKGEPLTTRVFLQRGLETQQAAQGDEMTLGTAALGERALAANPDEFGDFSRRSFI